VAQNMAKQDRQRIAGASAPHSSKMPRFKSLTGPKHQTCTAYKYMKVRRAQLEQAVESLHLFTQI